MAQVGIPRQLFCAVLLLVAIGAVSWDAVCAADGASRPAARTHYQRPEEPTGRTAFLRLPAGVVRPEGWLRDWCEAARDGVLGHPYDFPPPECAQVYGKGWTGVDLPGSKGARGHGAHWPAEQCATWFEGAMKLGAILEDRPLVNRIRDRLLLVAENVQKAPEDSFLFYWWTSNAYPWSPEGTPNKPGFFDQYYSNGNLGTAMAAGYEITRDRRILEAMETAYSRRWRERPDSGGVASTNGEAILRAWAASGSPTLAKVAVQLIKNTNTHMEWHLEHDKGPRRGNLLGFDKRTHTASFLYGRICSTRTSPWHDYTQETIEQNERIFRAVEQYYMLPNGGMQGDEVARGIGAYKGHESCSNMLIRWSGDLLRTGGRGHYGDAMEKCFFNVLPACLQRDMKGYTYFHNPNEHPDAPPRSHFVPLHGTLCCLGQMTKSLTYYVQNMWMATRDNGLAWMAYGPCSVEAKVADGVTVRLESDTGYPFEEQIELSVDPERPAAFPLKFRVPEWCEDFTVEINGTGPEASPDQDGFVELRRRWKPGDKVTLSMPMQPRVQVARELEGAPFAAVHYGPLTMALPTEMGDRRAMEPDAEWKFAIDAPEGAEKSWKLERSPMPDRWDWPLDAPLSLSVTAVPADWEPVLRKAHDVAEELKRRDNIVTYTQNDVTCLPAEPLPNGERTTIKLIPYGCVKYRVTMFPITGRTTPRIEVPNPAPAPASAFIWESGRGSGWESLFNGKDLSGWIVPPVPEDCPAWARPTWKVTEGAIDCSGGGRTLITDREFGDYILRLEWRWKFDPENPPNLREIALKNPDGTPKLDASGAPLTEKAYSLDSGIFVRGESAERYIHKEEGHLNSGPSQVNLWVRGIGSGSVFGARPRESGRPDRKADREPGRWNKMEITVVGKKVSVALNGIRIVRGAEVPHMPDRGPIHLQAHGGESQIQFRNLHIKEFARGEPK